MEQTEYMFAFNALSQGKCWRCEKEGDIIPLIESGKGSRKLSIFCRHCTKFSDIVAAPETDPEDIQG
eukprot:243522-Hanusia_phi.AAC.1